MILSSPRVVRIRTVGAVAARSFALVGERSRSVGAEPVDSRSGLKGGVRGRRNWLFADTLAGARASARLYSLVQCAKANGLEPYAYLRRVFTELHRAQSLGDIEALLPTRLTAADLN